MTDPALDLQEQKMQFIYALRSKGVIDQRVLAAMERMDRHTMDLLSTE